MKIQKTFVNSQRHIFLFASFLLLAGCASAPPARIRAEVPVMTSCIGEVPARPTYEFGALSPAAADGEIILALTRDWPRGRKYEQALEAIIEGCLFSVEEHNRRHVINF